MTLKYLSVITLVVALISCGSDNESVSGVPVSDSISNVETISESQLKKFNNIEKVCEILSVDDIKLMFSVKSDVSANPSNYSRVNCDYSWQPEDRDERTKLFMARMSQAANGQAKTNVSSRESALDLSIAISLSEFKGDKSSFIPPKLTEEQLQKQIESAKQRANKRLSEEQKKIAGDAATSMIENLLRKSNENMKIDGIGDSAYWSYVGQGSLHFLSGNIKVEISPVIAKTMDEDIENAKAIARKILNAR